MIMMGDRKKAVAQILGPKKEVEGEGDDDAPSSLHVSAREAMDALKSDDESAFLDAMKAIFMEFDSEPHEEGPHI